MNKLKEYFAAPQQIEVKPTFF